MESPIEIFKSNKDHPAISTLNKNKNISKAYVKHFRSEPKKAQTINNGYVTYV